MSKINEEHHNQLIAMTEQTLTKQIYDYAILGMKLTNIAHKIKVPPERFKNWIKEGQKVRAKLYDERKKINFSDLSVEDKFRYSIFEAYSEGCSNNDGLRMIEVMKRASSGDMSAIRFMEDRMKQNMLRLGWEEEKVKSDEQGPGSLFKLVVEKEPESKEDLREALWNSY